jgi:NADPH:quinone reductase-like Zn-dependent oxidoreductase
VGGKQGDRLITVLRRGGRLIPINVGPSPERAAEAGVIFGTSHRQRLHSDEAQLTEIGRLVEVGHLRIVVEKVFPLAEARRAHEYVEHHHLRGKMVLLVKE